MIPTLRTALLAAGAAGLLLQAAGAAPPQYGTAVVQRGEMTIAREGTSLSFRASSKSIPVNEKDLVRVRDGSEVVLTTRDRGTVTIGANAVFQCDPWQGSGRTGVLRLLFGRFRAKAVVEAKSAGFNVKTRNATIGVKGTEYTVALSSAGNTAVLSLENTVTVAGPAGTEQWISPGRVSVVVGDNPATPPVAAPEEFKRAMAKLDSPRLGTPTALDLPAERALIDQHIVTKEALEKSKQDKTRILRSGGAVDVPLPQLNLDDSTQSGASGRKPEPVPK